MAITEKHYNELASHAYKNGNKNPNVTLDGVKYTVLKYSSDTKTGYQGTIYKSEDTGEIVVAHRGTEPLKNEGTILNKDLIADLIMTVDSKNPQVSPALKLTNEAIRLANNDKNKVTVVGHSLGGTLAQVSAFEYGLKAQTFNAYGAIGLNYINLNGSKKSVSNNDNNNVTNHMIAGDLVSAANNHYGKTKMYAYPGTIKALKESGYGNKLLPNNLIVAVAKQMLPPLDAHKAISHMIIDSDEQKNTNAKKLAKENEKIINEYRGDIQKNKAKVIKDSDNLKKILKIFTIKGAKKISDNTDYLQENSTLNAQKEGKGDLNDIMNNDVKSIYAKLESSLGPQLVDKGADKWAEAMIAATTYACVEKDLSVDKIAHIGINEKENVIYAVSENKIDFATVNAIEASKVNPEQTLLAANQLHEQLSFENQQKEASRQIQMNQQHDGIKFA